MIKTMALGTAGLALAACTPASDHSPNHGPSSDHSPSSDHGPGSDRHGSPGSDRHSSPGSDHSRYNSRNCIRPIGYQRLALMAHC